MLEFLPPRMLGALNFINLDRLYEMRVRAGKPLLVNLGGTFSYLGERGICTLKNAILPTQKEIDEIVFCASGYSVYAVEDQIRRGFLTGSFGERIGIAGSYVYEGKDVLSVRSVTSLCIRIPHEILGCAKEIYQRCGLENSLCSLLILAPPGEGKTTILRDLSRLVCEKKQINVLLCDERGELSAGDTGSTSDVMKFADKLTAFTAGIRAMRPDLLICDELLKEDYPALRRAVECGICVFASSHLHKFEYVPDKLFSRYVFLDGLGRVGKICGEDGVALD